MSIERSKLEPGSREWFETVKYPEQDLKKSESEQIITTQKAIVNDPTTLLNDPSHASAAYTSYHAVKKQADNVAHLYRIKDLDNYKNSYSKKLSEALLRFIQGYLRIIEKEYGSSFLSSEMETILDKKFISKIFSNHETAADECLLAMVQYFEENKDDCLRIINLSYENKNNRLEHNPNNSAALVAKELSQENQAVFDVIRDALAMGKFFNLKNLSPLELIKYLSEGHIYQLQNKIHTWLNNLAWMLANFHKSSEFIIFSEISETHLHRKTEGFLNDVSGFAREIALATKFGYKFFLDKGRLKMLPPTDSDVINKLSVKNAWMTDDEVRLVYLHAKNRVDKLFGKQLAITSPNITPKTKETGGKIKEKKLETEKELLSKSKKPKYQ